MTDAGVIPLWQLGATQKARWIAIVEQYRLNPTLLPEWTEICVETIGGGRQGVSVYSEGDGGDNLRAVIPFFVLPMQIGGLRMRVLQPASNMMSYHAEVVASGDIPGTIDRWLQRAPAWDVMHFANVVSDNATCLGVLEVASKRNWYAQRVPGESSPFLAIDSTWPEFMSSKNKKFRYKFRRRQELLGKKNYRLAWVEDESSAARLLDEMLLVESRSWKVAEARDIGSRSQEIEYHRSLIPFLAHRGYLMACVLYCDDRPIAYNLCCCYGGWVGQLKTSFDEQYSSESPGSLVIDMTIERAFLRGAREFDFLGDSDPHKLLWTHAVRSHESIFVFGGSAKSRAMSFLKRLMACLRGRAAGHAGQRDTRRNQGHTDPTE